MNSPFNLSRKYNTIAAIIGGAVLGTIIISAFLIAPAWSNLKKLGLEVPLEQQKRNTAETQLNGLKEAKEFLEKNEEQVDQVNIAIPTDPQVPQILLVLEQLAKDNKVRLTTFQPQTPASGGSQSGQAAAPAAPGAGGAASGGTAVEITANFEGSYGSLINFFYTLERSLRIIDVKTITVSSGGTSTVGAPPAGAAAPGAATPTAAMTGAISFTAYYVPVSGTAGGGAR